MASISANGARGHHKFTLNISETATSIANNTSTVSFNLQLSPIQSGWDWAISGISYKITINGTNYTGTIPNYNGSSTITLKSGTQSILHNPDGSKTLNYSFSVTDTAGQSYTPGNASASGTLILTKIARYTRIKAFSVSKRSETSVTFNWQTADTIDYVWISKDNGSSWSGLDIADGTSGSFNVGSLTPNTKYNFKLRVRRKDSQLTTDSAVVTQTTYKIPTQAKGDVTETSIKISWTLDATADQIQYSKDGGKTWSTATTVNATNGSYTINSLNPNTSYNIKTRVRRKSSQTVYDTASLTIKTYDYPYCTDNPNFKIGDKLNLKFYNPLGRTFKFYIISNGIQISNNWTISGTSYSGIDANDTQNQLYATIPNTKSATYQVKVVYGTSTKTRNNNNTVSIRGNEKPIFTASQITYQDSSTVTNITGNNQHIVRSQSNLKVSYTAASPQKHASIKKYDITFNGVTQTKTSASTIDYGKVNLSSSTNVTIIVEDSRGLTTKVTKSITILDWILPSGILFVKRVNNYEDTTKIKVQTKYSSINGKNSIQEMKFRYKKVSEESWGSYIALNNNIEKSISIDKLFQWNLQIVIRDKFGTVTYNLIVPKGMPIMFFDIAKLAVGVNCFPKNKETLCVNGSDFLEYDVVDEW